MEIYTSIWVLQLTLLLTKLSCYIIYLSSKKENNSYYNLCPFAIVFTLKQSFKAKAIDPFRIVRRVYKVY